MSWRTASNLLMVAAASFAGRLFALRTEKLLRYVQGSGEMPFAYTADDALTRVVLVGCVILFVALVMVMARLEKRGRFIGTRRRFILVALFALAGFMLTFEGVLEFRNPDKFFPSFP